MDEMMQAMQKTSAALGLNSTNVMFLSLLTPAILVCVLAPLIILRQAGAQPRARLPPGPRALPIIGHLHLLGAIPHQALYNLSKTYGPLMSLKLGTVPLIVASSASAAKQILQTHDRSFSGRAPSIAAHHLHGCSDIAFSQPGPYWKLMRQICSSDLFASKRLRSFSPSVEEEVRFLMSSILNDNHEAGVPLRDMLCLANNNIIFKMALGKRLSEAATNSQHNLINLLLESNRLLGMFNVSDFIPWLAWMDLQGLARGMKIISFKLSSILQEIIDVRRDFNCQQGNGPQQRDFLDVLLSSTTSPNNLRKDVPIMDDNIKAVLLTIHLASKTVWALESEIEQSTSSGYQEKPVETSEDIFLGGTDTSATTIEWALGEILANPMIMKTLQEELEKVVGTSRLVHVSDIPHLPYLQAVVKETFRLHPALTLLVPHMSTQLCEIYGYKIPSGTQAFVNVWAIGRDPNTWERPLEFLPERFLDKSVDVRGQHFELLPFGSGRRACPGWMVGTLNVQFILASLLHSFDWTPLEKINLSEKFGLLTTLATPLVAKATPKLPRSFFQGYV